MSHAFSEGTPREKEIQRQAKEQQRKADLQEWLAWLEGLGDTYVHTNITDKIQELKKEVGL